MADLHVPLGHYLHTALCGEENLCGYIWYWWKNDYRATLVGRRYAPGRGQCHLERHDALYFVFLGDIRHGLWTGSIRLRLSVLLGGIICQSLLVKSCQEIGGKCEGAQF